MSAPSTKNAINHRLDEIEEVDELQGALKKRKIVWAEDMARLRRLMGYVKPYRWRMMAGLATGAVFVAINGGFPKAVEQVTIRLFEADTPPSFWMVLLVGLAIPAYYAVRGLVGYINSYMIAWVGTSVLRDLRVEVFSHVQRLSLDFFVQNKVANLTQRVSHSTGTMQRLAIELSDDLVKQPLTIVIVIVMLAKTNIWFCLVGIFLGVVCLAPMRYFGNKSRRAARNEEESEGQLMGVLYESFTNVGIIKAYETYPEAGERPGDTVPRPAPVRSDFAPRSAGQATAEAAVHVAAAPATPNPGRPEPPRQRPNPPPGAESVPGGQHSQTPAALSAPLTVLQGVGPKHAATLETLGLHTLGDLLYFYPRRYDDYSQLKPIKSLWYGEQGTVIGGSGIGELPPDQGRSQDHY